MRQIWFSLFFPLLAACSVMTLEEGEKIKERLDSLEGLERNNFSELRNRIKANNEVMIKINNCLSTFGRRFDSLLSASEHKKISNRMDSKLAGFFHSLDALRKSQKSLVDEMSKIRNQYEESKRLLKSEMEANMVKQLKRLEGLENAMSGLQKELEKQLKANQVQSKR